MLLKVVWVRNPALYCENRKVSHLQDLLCSKTLQHSFKFNFQILPEEASILVHTTFHNNRNFLLLDFL